MDCRVEATTPTEQARAAILAGLTEFNTSNGYPSDFQQVAVVLRGVDDEILGGLWGKTVYDWMFVEYLIVPEALRGHDFGAQLMKAAEAIAMERGCVGAWLTTFSFQARGFYEKLGYRVFGELENSPDDNVRIFMRKRFAR